MNRELFENEDNVEEEDIKKNISFSFDMPPEDQKVLGTWRIFAYLYDNKDLASYIVYEFDVAEDKSMILLDMITIMITSIAAGAMVIFMTNRILRRKIFKNKKEKK